MEKKTITQLLADCRGKQAPYFGDNRKKRSVICKDRKVEKLKENRSSQHEWLTIDHGSDDSIVFKENVI